MDVKRFLNEVHWGVTGKFLFSAKKFLVEANFQ